MKNKFDKGYIALAIVCFFWGTTFLAIRIGARHIPGLFIAGVRQFSAGAILAGFFLLRGYSLPDRRTLRTISIQGILLLSIANGMLSWSLQYISSGLAAIIAGLVPLFVALFSIWLIGKARFTLWMLAGLLIGFAGILTIFYDYLHLMMNPAFAFGVALALAGTLSWSFGTVYTSRNRVPIDILFAVGLQMLIAGSVTLTVCLLSGKYVNLLHSPTGALYSIAYLVFFGSLLGYTAYVFAISRLPATLVSIYAYINPVVAIGLGWLLLHEKLNGNVALGAMITLGGVYLVSKEFRKQKTSA